MKKYKNINDVVTPMTKLLRQIIKYPEKSGYVYNGVDIFGQDFLSVKETFSEESLKEYLEDTCNPQGILGVFVEKCFHLGFCVGYKKSEESSSYKDEIIEMYKEMISKKTENDSEEGLTLGLIDGMITNLCLLKKRNLSSKAIRDAMEDLKSRLI